MPPPQADAEAVDGEPAAKRAKVDGEGGEGEASGEAIAEAATSMIPAGAPGAPPPDEDSAANLEASLQSCTAHRDRILQMLQEEPENRNLIELRDQLTNAINQLQGTKNMV